jgi:hypothetical protein
MTRIVVRPKQNKRFCSAISALLSEGFEERGQNFDGRFVFEKNNRRYVVEEARHYNGFFEYIIVAEEK